VGYVMFFLAHII